MKKQKVEIMPEVASTTVIGKGIKLEAAKFTGSDTVIINGTYLGDIDLDGFLKIGETGSVIGNIRAKQIEIAGKTKGVVICDATVYLTATAYVEGGIATQILKTDEGARINGQCRMVNDQTETMSLELSEIEGKLNFDFSTLGDALIPDKGLPTVF
ncbi:MAG: polymer-forming cytoskeletal protein [Oscillospiraceae bacterium]|jgi:cytoskeletal protein CcmA (bactofilin family)|nr:polymer-forming cytoskeletal protein [Oscillospiraceae bacterium]